MNDESQLEQLRFAIHGVNAPFFCAGSYVPQKPLTLKFSDNMKFVVEVAENKYQQAEMMQWLIDRCQPATFGDKRRNRYDRSVREALQLKAETGQFSVEHFDLQSSGILDAIQRELLPPGSAPITAELYALNIYLRDGHFAPHKDTPRGEDMFGTLVVCLLSFFGVAN